MEYVEVRSDSGQVYRFRFGMTGLRWLEEQVGESFVELGRRLEQGGNVSLALVSALVAAGLRHEWRDITLDDADEVIDNLGLQRTMDAVLEAFTRSNLFKGSGDAEAGEGTVPKNAAGTGTKSSRQPRTSA